MILVTGGAGHLGNVLVRELISEGRKVRVLTLPGEKLQSLEGLDVEIVEGNILNTEDLDRAFKDVDLVFHMAALVAITPEKFALMEQVNVEGTHNIIEAVKKHHVKRLVYTSSIHALERAPHGKEIDESMAFDTINPAGPYDRTKAQASMLVIEATKGGVDAVIVCPTGVIGPHDYSRSEIGEMILDWMKNQPSISTDGAFDFVDVRDVARGHILAAEKGRSGEVYLLSGEQIQVSHMRKIVQLKMGIHTWEIKFPAKLAMLIAPLAELFYKITHTRPRLTKYSIETLLSNSRISSAKARKELDFRPRSLKDSIHETVEWWIKNKSLIRSSLRGTPLDRAKRR